MIDPKSAEELAKEAKALAPEIYTDIAKPALSEVGAVAGRTVKALLSPMRGMLWGWEQIEQIVEEGIKKRFEKIPEERRKSPEPEIAVPLLQALSYTAQNETLREMYINLLANSMDIDKQKEVHPSFVEIIKQMNSLDAKVFEKLSVTVNYQKIYNPRIGISTKNQFFKDATPEWYLGWIIDGFDEFDVSASLIRLSKFGIIELLRDRTAGGKGGYELMKDTDFLNNQLEKFQTANPTLPLGITGTESLVYVNEYGKQFKIACN